MSKADIFRGGGVATQSFAATLSDILVPTTPKKRGQNEAVLARERLLQQAHDDAVKSGHDEGFEVGKTVGYQAGFDQAYAEASNQQSEMLRQFATELQKVHDDLEINISEWFAAAEIEVEALSVQIAETLIDAQLSLDRSFVVEATKSALQHLTEANKARIRVNPFDAVILNNAREEVLAATASLRGIEIVSDSSIDGGCVIETERGAIDATVQNRLRLLEGGLEGAA